MSDAPLLAQAVRRAVMSLAARLDSRRQLPVFFTGHKETTEPVRGEHHGHLFYLTHDTDGDGLIDYLAIVAPHMADRTTDGSASVRDSRLLERALQGLRVVRAGRLGVLELSPTGSQPREVFGSSSTWESLTMYRPTRHPRRGAAADTALMADLKAECARRALPVPDVSVLDVIAGPRGGLRCRARLTFATPINGPVLLGPGSHFGGGLFGAV